MSKHHHHGQSHSGEAQNGDTQTLTTGGNEGAAENAGPRPGVIAALKSAREMAETVRQKAVAGAKVADQTVHKHTYKSLGVAVGLGILIGMFLVRRNSRKTV